MQWLALIVLAVFVYRQDRAIKALKSRLDDALRDLSVATSREAGTTGQTTAPPQAPATQTEVARPAAASAARDKTLVAPTMTTALRTPGTSTPLPVASRSQSTSAKPITARAPTWASMSTWLAENGLAWIGGGGLALGGLLLVVYAAQRGVFTPPLRILAAAVLGGAMIAASEWILHRTHTPGGQHRLAAAVAAGAGAVTLYGAVCAAYVLYRLIPFPAAAVLAAAISFGLLGLALRHGQALALLALVGALITPGITGMSAWSPVVLQAYVLLIGATGFTLAGVRQWGGANAITLAGLLLWSFAAPFNGGALLLLLAAVGPTCAVYATRVRHPHAPVSQAFSEQPAVALAFASLASFHLWISGSVAEAALVAGALTGLAAATARLNLAHPRLFFAPVGTAVVGALLTLWLGIGGPAVTPALPWIYALTGLIPIATLAAALGSPPAARTVLLTIGGIGVAILASLAWPLLDAADVLVPWLPAAVLAVAMFGSAPLIVRRVEDPTVDRGLAIWLAAAAELAFLALHAATPARFEPVAFGLAALILGGAAGRLGWRGLAGTAVVAGLATLATLFHPDLLAATLEGRLSLPVFLAVAGAASALLFAGAKLIPGRGAASRNEVEAQTTAALMVLLTGLFAGLHVILAGIGGNPATGGLFEASLRTLLLLAAGLLLVSRQRTDDGPISRWRTVILVGAGIAHGLVMQGLAWNPWWGLGLVPAGPPVVNILILIFLAPAVLLVLSGWRRQPTDAWSRTWIAAGALFAVLWALMTLRHLFHGADMGAAAIGRAEAAAYAVLALATVRLLLSRRLMSTSGRTDWLKQAAHPAAGVALAASLYVFALYSSPWWGPSPAPLSSVPGALLLFALYGLGAISMSRLRGTGGAIGMVATAGSIGVLFALMSLLIRWGFHGGAMKEATPGGGFETWTFSALWAVFGLVTLGLGTARKNATVRWVALTVLMGTAAKVLIFDLARLEGVTRAASFLAVGALFLGGALAARRLNAKAGASGTGTDMAAPPDLTDND